MVFIHLAEGFEEVEALTCVDILRRAGVDTQTVSITGTRMVTGTHGIRVEADILFDDADYSQCEMIVLPGGMPGATNLEAHSGLADQIKAFAKSGKLLAAICAAPLVFATHGIISGRRATIYPGMESYLKDAVPTGENVTVDDNVITGAGPAVAMEFALELVRVLEGDKASDIVKEGILYSRI